MEAEAADAATAQARRRLGGRLELRTSDGRLCACVCVCLCVCVCVSLYCTHPSDILSLSSPIAAHAAVVVVVAAIAVVATAA